MEQVTKTIGMVCIIIMATGILNDIGSFPVSEKVIKFVTALCIIAAFFKSVGGTKLEMEFDYNNDDTLYVQNEEYLKSAVLNRTAEELEQLVKKRLGEKNISYNSVSVHILEQNSSVMIEKIQISCDPEFEAEVRLCLEDITSEGTEILIGE